MDIAPFLDKPTAIVGTVGAGKTFAAKGAVERLLELGRRVVIIDPTGAWYGLRAGADGNPDGGFPVLIFGGDHADIPITPDGEAGKALAMAIADRDVQAIIDTSEMTGGEKNRFLTPFLENLYARNKAALHLVVDEADEVAAQRLADGEQRLFGAFDKIVRRGRIKGFRPLMISQRPAVIHKNVLSQIGTLIALKLTSPQDRKAIEEWVKGNADADQARAVMTSLPGMQRGEGWVWSPADSVLERVTFPPIRTFDSSRTPGDGEAVVAPALTAVDVDALRRALSINVQSPASNQAAKMNTPDPAAIEAAEARGLERGFLAGMKLGWRQGHAAAWLVVKNTAEQLEEESRRSHIMPEMQADWRERYMAPALKDAGSPSGKATAFGAVTAGSNPAPAAKPSPRITNVARSEYATSPLGAERKPLAVLAAAYPAGYTEAQWASLAGFKRTGGTWSTYKSRLRKAGLIEDRSDLWFATEASVEAFGGNLPTLPATPEERLAMWKSKVAGVGPMLDALARAYPAPLSRDELAARLDMAASGGTFSTYLSRLRSNGLIEEPERGCYRLSSAIMGDI